MRLAESAIEKAFRLATFKRLGSTNDEALARAEAGDPGALWVVAAEQAGGKGRQGRTWVSPPGNLYASLLLIDPGPPRNMPELGFVAGVALARSLRDILGGDTRICIKWPNDILHNGCKLSGILLESLKLPDGKFACVIGIGVNCSSHPQNLAYKATDLAEIGSLLADAEQVFLRLSAELAHWLDIWDRGRGFQAIRMEWLLLAAGIGTQIKVSAPFRTMEGLFRTIDSAGRLILETEAGPIAVEAGDIFLSNPPKGTLAAHVS